MGPEHGGRVEGVLRIATRGSALALRQAGLVADALARSHPGIRTENVVVTTKGDLMADAPIDRIGGQGVFAKEIQRCVLDGGAELAVHSAKDLPPRGVDGLRIAAVPPRADPRDALVGVALSALAPGARIATGSARRRAQLANLRPDLTFVDLRGNVERRVARTDAEDVAAVVVAMAALDRLGLSDRPVHVLSPNTMLPQIGQGALAVECRADDQKTAALLRAIDDPDSHRALDAERALLEALGASCSVPVAGWARLVQGRLRLDGMLATGDGRVVLRTHGEGEEPEALGAAIATRLLEECGGASIEGWDRADAISAR
ncbi:MAG TPA: hydroxymethylbilane synthase [Acidimicrobiales bacterium]|nr:hydroxymethylbilane synthase [Acidimicrobiales bacterium]